MAWGGITDRARTRDGQYVLQVQHTDTLYRPGFLDNNAGALRTRIVTADLQQLSACRMSWPATSPDVSHIEHVWDMVGDVCVNVKDRRPRQLNLVRRCKRS